MAVSVYLYLKASGVEIKGEAAEKGREGAIECLSYDQKVTSTREGETGLAVGRRQYDPIVFRKHIDQASPLLKKALTASQPIEATFKFFRPNPTGDGTTQQFYTVAIKQGRVAGVREYLAAPGDPHAGALEDVQLVFNAISWTYTDGGITHEDAKAPSR